MMPIGNTLCFAFEYSDLLLNCSIVLEPQNGRNNLMGEEILILFINESPVH